MANCKKYPTDKALPDENNKCSLCGGDCTNEQEKPKHELIQENMKPITFDTLTPLVFIEQGDQIIVVEKSRIKTLCSILSQLEHE